MKPRRKSIGWKTKFCAARRIRTSFDYDRAKAMTENQFLAELCLGHGDWKYRYALTLSLIGGIPPEHFALMHIDQIISLFQVNHDIQHGIKVVNHFSNLTPMLKAEHAARFRKDNAVVKKVARILRKAAERKNPTRRKATIAARVDPWPKGRKIKSRNTLARGKKDA